MIFVTVGAQMPFDRLSRAVDAWAARAHRRDIFAQIGATSWHPQHIQWTQFLPPAEFTARVRDASLVVAHAGMGSILTALEFGKSILVMPRRGDLAETRNDHQVATARHFATVGKLSVAFDEVQLADRLDHWSDVSAHKPISHWASPELLGACRHFIAADARPAVPLASRSFARSHSSPLV